MHNEIFTTMLVFLSSTNREIVKSILGFVKLVIHTLPADLIRPHLKDLVPALLSWSHDHKNHFKVKVRHIFERMLRRFTWEEIYSCAEDDEASKVLINIKKRKERAKRRKTNREQEDEEADEACPDSLLNVSVPTNPKYTTDCSLKGYCWGRFRRCPVWESK
jgi:ribosomal RNA-processing protein 12